MKPMRWVAMMAAAMMMIGACTGHESITAPYDDEVVASQSAATAAATGTTAKKTSRRRSAGRGTGEAFQFEGVIRSAAAGSLVVFTSKKEEVTIALTPQTVIRKGNATLTIGDLFADARVHVKALQSATGYTALEVKLQDGGDGDDDGSKVRVELRGTVASVTAASFVVTTATGDATVQVTSSTQIRRGGKKVSLSDVTVGSTVEVEGRRVSATAVEAKKVTVEG